MGLNSLCNFFKNILCYVVPVFFIMHSQYLMLVNFDTNHYRSICPFANFLANMKVVGIFGITEYSDLEGGTLMEH